MRNAGPGGIRSRALVAIAVLCCVGAAQTVTSGVLREALQIKDLEFDAPGETLRAHWPWTKTEQLRAFERFGTVALAPGTSRLEFADRSGLRLREAGLRPPCRIAFDLRPDRPSSILEFHFAPGGMEHSPVVAFFNRPVPGGEGPARRSDGVLRIDHGVRGDALAAAPCATAAAAGPGRIAIDVSESGIRISRDDLAVAEAPVAVPAPFGVLVLATWGGSSVGPLTIEGGVSGRSVIKLLHAVRSTKKSETAGPAADVALAAAGARASMIRQERGDSRIRVVAELRKGRLGWGGPVAGGAKLKELQTLITAAGGAQGTGSGRSNGALLQLAAELPQESFLSYLVALQEVASGDRAGAADRLRATLGRVRNFPEAWRLLAVLELEAGDGAESLRCLESARGATGASEAWTQAFLGLVHLQQGAFGQARTFLESARASLRDVPGVGVLERSAAALARGPFGATPRRRVSDRYLIEGNLSQEEIDRLGASLDRFRGFLETALPLPRAAKDKARVWLFDSREEYLAFTDVLVNRLEHTLGVFIPSLNTLMFHAGLSEAQDQNVVFHEAFHQYLATATTTAPIWLNEGLAEYYGATVFGAGGEAGVGGILEGRLAMLRSHAAAKRPRVPFAKILTMAPAEYMSAPAAPLHYAQSWAMCHWFKQGAEDATRALFDAYLRAILAGTPAQEAYRDTFAALRGDGLAALESAFDRYVADVLLPRLARADEAEGTGSK